MTASERHALDLVNKYRNQPVSWTYESTINGILEGYMTNDSAKRCAILAVEELISEHRITFKTVWNDERIRFWREVIIEIEKL